MITLLLTIIYTAFISLGLPDSLLGSGWPSMSVSMGAQLSYAGIVTIIISCMTILSSFMSNFLNRKLGTGMVVALSVTLTSLAMFGFSFSTKFWMLCAFAIPYGFGAGAIDAALNNYVALHFSSKHMSWLHCFWGIGAIISPYIMGICLTSGIGWNWGYRIVGIIQGVLAIIMFCALPLWKKAENRSDEKEEKQSNIGVFNVLKIKGVWFVLLAFFAYCALEQTTMLWSSSYFSLHFGLSDDKAAFFGSFVFIGLTAGRFISGFVSEKIGDKNLIRIGTGIAILGMIMVAIPAQTYVIAIIGFAVAGLGFAPIYPSIIHSTPSNFGKENSQSIIGVEMAIAYVGILSMPPVFGVIAEKVDIAFLPLFVGVFTILMLVSSEIVNAKVRNHIIK